MTLDFWQLPNNTQRERLGTYVVVAGQPVEPIAQERILLPNPQTHVPEVYQFLFWNIGGQVFSNPSPRTNAPAMDFSASAWYFLVGGGPGKPEVVSYAFAANKNRVLTDNPIQSVSPPGLEQGNVVDNSATAVTILARVSVAGDPGASFGTWVQYPSGGGTVVGSELEVPAGLSEVAIASYVLLPTIQAIGSDEVPAHVGVIVGVQGSGFTPNGAVYVSVGGPSGVHGLTTALGDGSITWGASTTRLRCGAAVKASATDETTGLVIEAPVAWECLGGP